MALAIALLAVHAVTNLGYRRTEGDFWSKQPYLRTF